MEHIMLYTRLYTMVHRIYTMMNRICIGYIYGLQDILYGSQDVYHGAKNIEHYVAQDIDYTELDRLYIEQDIQKDMQVFTIMHRIYNIHVAEDVIIIIIYSIICRSHSDSLWKDNQINKIMVVCSASPQSFTSAVRHG